MTSQRQTTLFEDVQFDADELANQYDDDCQWLVPLSDWQITVILSLLRYAEWPSRWVLGSHTWDEIDKKISELEYCLMAGCNVSDLITTQRMLVAAITGTSVDLDSELPTGIVDYSEVGLASTMRYDDKNIAQIVQEQGEGVDSFTLQEFIDNFDPEELTTPLYAGIYAMLNLMRDILPDELVKNYRFQDPPGFLFEVLNSLGDKAIAILQAAFQGAEATATTGAAVADVADTAVTGLDTIFQGVTAGALSLQAIIDLINLFKSGQTPDADTDPALRSLTRVYNDVFVEGDAINVNCTPEVNCGSGGGCGCGGGGALGSPITGSLVDSDPAEELGDPEIDPPPTGFDSWEEYDIHKCRAANFISQGTEELFRLFGTANSYVSAGAIAGAGAAITELLFGAASMAMSAGVLGGAAGVSLLAGGVILTLPGWVVGAIVAAILLVIVAEVSILLLFINAADEYHANIEQTVCDLYNAQNVEDAKVILSTAWGDAIASFAIDPPYNAWEAAIRSMMSTVIGYVITNTLVNMLFEPSDLIDKYTDSPVDCDTCATPGIFDFTVDEQGWLIDEANSTNGDYDAVNGYFWGSNTGVTDAVLYIYYPELVTISNFKAWVKGKQSGVNRVEIFEAESLEGTWTSVDFAENISTPDFTMVELTDFNISNKYVKVHIRRFETDSTVYCQRIEWS